MNAQALTAESMMCLGIIPAVTQQPPNRKAAHGLGHGGLEIGCVVARSHTHLRGPDQMRAVVTDDREFRPAAVAFHTPLTMQEVPTDVVILEAGGVNAGFRLLGQQATGLGDTENGIEEPIKSPFFRSRCSA